MLQFNLADQLACDTNHSDAQPVSQAGFGTAAVNTMPKVAILLCTYQGERYLAEQLTSFEDQSHSNWRVWASDDGSIDDTRAILDAYQQRWPEGSLSVLSGPAEGFAANFISLTCNDQIDADFYAFSDQDDIWEADKLARAVDWLQSLPAGIPGLYCARTRLVDADNNDIGLSPLFSRSPSFANALTQNIAGGNTMVFNNAARRLLCETVEKTSVVTHDWWAYMLVAGCGGQVFYDPEPTLRYRQHVGNLVGVNSDWACRVRRMRMVFQGRFKQWSDSNIAVLSGLEHRLAPDSRKVFQRFIAARKMSLIPRLILLKRSGVYRQTLLGNIGLIAAAVLGKI